MLVKPLGVKAGEPFVAAPDGKQRQLNQMEADYFERQKVKPRRKIL